MSESISRSLFQLSLDGEIEGLWTCLGIPDISVHPSFRKANIFDRSFPKNRFSDFKSSSGRCQQPSSRRKRSADIFTSKKRDFIKKLARETSEETPNARLLMFLKGNMISANIARSLAYKLLLQGLHNSVPELPIWQSGASEVPIQVERSLKKKSDP